MQRMVLAGIVALSASASLAQTSTAPDPTAPAADPAAQQAGGPANLCQELLAFVRANPPKADAAPDAPAAASAPKEPGADAGAPVEEKSADAPARPKDGDASADEKTAVAGEDSSPASGEARPPQPPSESGSAQDVSGQSGPAHEAPDPNTEQAAQGNVEKAPQTSSLSAPVPTDATGAEKDLPLSLAGAEELADANDIVACQDAARKLRLSGAAMPPPLLALAALDLQYQQKSGEAPQPSGSGNPPAAGQDPAQQTPE